MLKRSCFFQVKVLKGEGLPTNYRSQTANISVKISLLPSRLPKVKIETHPPGCKKILDRNSFLLDRNSFFLLDRNSTRLGLSRTPLTLSSMRSSASSSPGFFQSFSQILWNDLSLWGQTRKFSISFILFREDTKGKVLRLTLLDHDREGKRCIQTFWSCLLRALLELFGFCSWIKALKWTWVAQQQKSWKIPPDNHMSYSNPSELALICFLGLLELLSFHWTMQLEKMRPSWPSMRLGWPYEKVLNRNWTGESESADGEWVKVGMKSFNWPQSFIYEKGWVVLLSVQVY